MADYDYGLPEEAIAQQPAEPRDSARLLVAIDPTGMAADHHVRDLPGLLRPGDLLVVNDTRVIPARLRLRKATGGAAEVLLLEPVDDRWEALVRPARRLPPGTVLFTAGGVAAVEVGERASDGTTFVRLLVDPATVGELALPPYLTAALADPSRYQTVYAAHPGSVAAPTAGLHLTTSLLDECRAAGIGVASLDLTVGLDTFRPVMVADPADHRMHSEAYAVPRETWDACRSTRERGGRVVAVGTTAVRALESAMQSGRLAGRTDLYIRRGFRFGVVDLLLTNFHLPRSTLLLLLEAFTGDAWRELYRVALARDYRFLSLGDAMLVGPG